MKKIHAIAAAGAIVAITAGAVTVAVALDDHDQQTVAASVSESARGAEANGNRDPGRPLVLGAVPRSLTVEFPDLDIEGMVDSLIAIAERDRKRFEDETDEVDVSEWLADHDIELSDWLEDDVELSDWLAEHPTVSDEEWWSLERHLLSALISDIQDQS